jgi:hypothetical protein
MKRLKLSMFRANLAAIGAVALLADLPGCGREAELDDEELGLNEAALCAERPLLVQPGATTASSLESAQFPAAYATDGNPATRWSSAFSDPQWLSVDLGAPKKIRRVLLKWEAAASARYDLQVSQDGSSWTTIHSDERGNGGDDDIRGLDASARYLRVYSHARTTQWGVSLWSLEVFGDDDASCSDSVQCASSALVRMGASASSVEPNTGHVAGNARDGDGATRWSSAFADGQWLSIDLGAERWVNRVRLAWEAAYAHDYEVQIASSQGGPWTSLYRTTAGNGGIDDLGGLAGRGRYVRVLANRRATAWGNSLWEVEVFGDDDASCSDEQPAALRRNVLWLVYDPILSSGQRLHAAYGWNDPFALIPQITSTLRSASHGYADYVNVEIRDLPVFPPQLNREQFNEASYAECFDGTTDCSPTQFDYGRAFAELDLCRRIESGEIDEVMMYGADYFGMDEFAFKIPGDRMPYDTPTNYWLYEGRKKNLPECGRTYFVMGFNVPVGLDNAIHSYGHRTESALSLTVGRGHFDGCRGGPAGLTDWDRFTCIDLNKTASGASVAGCGNVHYPPNGLVDYDYGNPRTVTSTCQSWANYPFSTPTLADQDCSAYGCDHLGYMQWWLGSLPRHSGVTANGNLRNWWKYTLDFDSALRELGRL